MTTPRLLYALPSIALLLVTALATPAAAAENVVVAAGLGDHGWCAVDGCSVSCPGTIAAFTVTVELTTGAATIEGASRCGFPGFEFAPGQCAGTPTGTVSCVGFFGATLSLSSGGYMSFYSGLLVEHWASGQLVRA